jgi:hypothetical protein
MLALKSKSYTAANLQYHAQLHDVPSQGIITFDQNSILIDDLVSFC